MQVERKGNQLTITVPLDPKGKPSSTGKSIILYTSGGFLRIEDDLAINLTVIKK